MDEARVSSLRQKSYSYSYSLTSTLTHIVDGPKKHGPNLGQSGSGPGWMISPEVLHAVGTTIPEWALRSPGISASRTIFQGTADLAASVAKLPTLGTHYSGAPPAIPAPPRVHLPVPTTGLSGLSRTRSGWAGARSSGLPATLLRPSPVPSG